ncbi:MAG: DUF4179 domain-containing protein [Lachnospiraceae bacterium]
MKKNYTVKQIKQILKREISVPVIVTEQVADTLHTVCGEYDDEECKEHIKQYRKVVRIRKQIAAVLVICLLCAGATVTAAGLKKWNPYAAQEWRAGEVVQDEMMAEQTAVVPEISVTDNGVTVSVEQVVTDGLSEYVLFKVEAPENMELTEKFDFEQWVIWTDGSDEGLIDGAGGNVLTRVNPETQMLEKVNEEKNIVYYQWQMDIAKENGLKGKEVSFIFNNLVNIDNKHNITLLQTGRWELVLPEEIQAYAMKKTKHKTGQIMNAEDNLVQITEAVISPMNLILKGNYRDKVAEEYRYGDANAGEILPVVKAIRMKDGSERLLEDWMIRYDWNLDAEMEEKIGGMKNEEIYDAIKNCKEWKFEISIEFSEIPKISKLEADTASDWGIMDSNDVKEVILEYRGEEYIVSFE